MKTLIGRKVGMTQIFDEKGLVVPVTVIEAGPCPVVQVKTIETDGYNAVQLGFGEVKERRVNKPETGHFKKANIKPVKHLREFRACPECLADVKVGDEVKVKIRDVKDGKISLSMRAVEEKDKPQEAVESSGPREYSSGGEAATSLGSLLKNIKLS